MIESKWGGWQGAKGEGKSSENEKEIEKEGGRAAWK